MKQRSATKGDGEIGKRIRAARLVADMSQADLGDALGVSFQQVQKYERGVNRVAAGRLQQIAKALKVDMMTLMSPSSDAPPDIGNFMAEFFATPHAIEVARGFVNLDQRKRLAVRNLIVELV